MRKSLLAAAVAAGAFVLSFSAAQSGTLIPVPQVPGSILTFVSDINESNVIAGHYTTADGNLHGFFGSLDGQYTTFDHPKGQTNIDGINDDGFITGTSIVQNEHCPVIGCAFVRSPDGTINAIKKDGLPIDGYAEGIIGRAKFVAEQWILDQNNQLSIYGYYGKGHTVRAGLVLPLQTTRTRPRGLDKNGTITGYFRNTDGIHFYTGFILTNGVATTFDYPDQNTYSTFLEYFNAKGILAGFWEDPPDSFERAFLFDMVTGRIESIDVPGATYVSAHGISNSGLVTVNVTYDPQVGGNTPYIYCMKKTTCPQSPNAIEIPDKWIPAAAGSLHSVVCRNRCLGPAHVTGKPAVPAAIRDAMARDPALRMEMGLHRAQ